MTPSVPHTVVRLRRTRGSAYSSLLPTRSTFLKGDTGNRRWWVIEVGKQPQSTTFGDLTDDVVAQLWAEALHYDHGEQLSYPQSLRSKHVKDKSRIARADERIGIIQTLYINKLLPTDWASRFYREPSPVVVGRTRCKLRRCTARNGVRGSGIGRCFRGAHR